MPPNTIKETLFRATEKALSAYRKAYRTVADERDQYEAEGRFCGLYDLVERLELEDEYQKWKEATQP
ncbi:MAG: hypothetical protein LUC30_01120 [Clostridiales bacterium]|nr:hypothetical protein [Clostridiales bacterium]